MSTHETGKFAAVTLVCVSLAIGDARAADLVETARTAGNFTVLLHATDVAGMTTMLKGPGPFTVFAPTDEAFRALPPGALDMLLKPENRDQLRMVLGYHVAAGRLKTTDLHHSLSSVTMFVNMPVVLKIAGGSVLANDAHVVIPDIPADNGVVQVIDTVLIPATPVQPRT